MAMIELKAVQKSFGNQVVLERFSLTLEAGLVHVLIGPSGCGKTTVLGLMNGLVEPEQGRVLIAGKALADQDIFALRRQIGYVIQEVGLFPHFNIYDNIALVPRLLKWPEQKIGARVKEMMALVAVDPSRSDAFPHQLSGGQQQRIGVARALAADPQILLMDEPFSAVDPINRLRLQDAFIEIQKSLHKTVVFVTHDINEALKMGDRLYLMNNGKIEQEGAPVDLLRNPRSDFVREFIGEDIWGKLMGVLTIRDVMSPARPEGQSKLTIAADSNLQKGIEALIDHPEESLIVRDGEMAVGSLSWNDLKGVLKKTN